MPTPYSPESTRDELRLAAFDLHKEAERFAIASASRHGLLLEAKLLASLAETAPIAEVVVFSKGDGTPVRAVTIPAAISDAGSGPEGTGGEAVEKPAAKPRTPRKPKAETAPAEEAAK